MQCCNDVILTDEAVKAIQPSLANKLAFIISVDVAGNITPMSPISNKLTRRDAPKLSLNDPIPTTAITGIESASFVSFEGSCCLSITIGGTTYIIKC